MLGPGKKTKAWEKSRQGLKQEYLARGIIYCEIMLSGCWHNNGLTFAHRYKRRDSRCEHTFAGTVLACLPCHQKIEYDRTLTENIFEKLRPES